MKKSIVLSRRLSTALSALTVTVFCVMLAGCNVGPKYIPPAMTAPPSYKESPAQFKEADGWVVAQPQDAALRGKWWEIYNEPELNALEDQLNIDNQNIRQAFENFMVARAMVREARSHYFPTVSVGGSYTRSRASSNVGSASSTGATGGQQSQLFSLPGDISWEPDLWDKVRNTVRASQYTAQLTAADLENERLTEQASMAQYFFEIRGQDELQKILNGTVEADKKALEVERSAYDTGVADQISVVEAQTTLESAQSAAINIGIARAQYEHAIAMLVGKPASEFSIPVEPRTSAPPPIPVGLPSQLLERRPDVAAAERNMAVANAQIGVAYAAYYPALTLSATGGMVEDSLAAVRILSQQVRHQQEAVDSSQMFLKLELGRYETGIDPYIDVIIAQTTLLSNQQSLTNLQVLEMTASVQLIESLGGGWDRSQLPSPAQVTRKPSKSETSIQH